MNVFKELEKQEAIFREKQKLQKLLDEIDWDSYFEMMSKNSEFNKGIMALIKHLEWFNKANFRYRTLENRLAEAYRNGIALARSDEEFQAMLADWQEAKNDIRKLSEKELRFISEDVLI